MSEIVIEMGHLTIRCAETGQQDCRLHVPHDGRIENARSDLSEALQPAGQPPAHLIRRGNGGTSRCWDFSGCRDWGPGLVDYAILIRGVRLLQEFSACCVTIDVHHGVTAARCSGFILAVCWRRFGYLSSCRAGRVRALALYIDCSRAK